MNRSASVLAEVVSFRRITASGRWWFLRGLELETEDWGASRAFCAVCLPLISKPIVDKIW